MATSQFSVDKKKVIGDISLNNEEGVVRLILKFDKKYHTRISEELKQYGRVLYDQFPWSRHMSVEINDYQCAVDLVERLYSGGLEGVLNVGVDSRTVVLHSGYSRKREY